MIQRSVQSTVRDGLRTSLRESQEALGRMQAKSDAETNRFVSIAGENAGLEAGLQLLMTEHGSESARRTVEDQLRELGEHMGFDLLVVSAPDGTPLAGVARAPRTTGQGSELTPVGNFSGGNPPRVADVSMVTFEGRPYQTRSAPMDTDQENIGSITLGEAFDLSAFATPTVLMHNGSVVESNVANVPVAELNNALRLCPAQGECNARIAGSGWISLPMQDVSGTGEYQLRSLENVDAAMAHTNFMLRRLFLTVTLGAVVVALLCSFISARSTVKPIAVVVDRLRQTARTGMLPEFKNDISPILEIRELAESYNRAAGSVRKAQDDLQGAYVEFVGSLAQALDARDRYTAGHSQRVSDLACSIARALNHDEACVEKLRIGALLHDIGKIGVSDTVLQKPGRLTDEEFALVKQHPVMGKQILAGVQGFAPYLPAVELHHENWDGTGYPHRQRGEETPIEARIIHVADAYDAMTTNRSYRQGMTHARAMEILHECAGTQFDAQIVSVFAKTFDVADESEMQIARVDVEQHGLQAVEAA